MRYAIRWRVAVPLVAVGFALAAACHAQATLPPIGQSSSGGGTVHSHLPGMGDDDVPESASMRVRRETLRKTQRLQTMEASATRLLELTRQLHASLAEHPDITAEDARMLDQIAKLARDVKSRMVN